jgi:hypothetical protein
MTVPWKLLVQPGDYWRAARVTTPIGAVLLCQAALIFSGSLCSLKAQFLLAETFGWSASSGSLLALALLAPVALISVLAVDLLWAGLLMISAAVSGTRIAFSEAFALCAAALLPSFLGQALGQLVFGIAQYMPSQHSEALALRIRPFPFSWLVMAGGLEPLSFGWFFAAYFDLFALWSVYLLWLGLRSRLELPARTATWICASLVISLALALTAVWRGLQTMVSV